MVLVLRCVTTPLWLSTCRMMQKPFVLITLAVVCIVTAQACDFPPSLWCSSKEIAKACQVEKQCELATSIDPKPKPVELTLYYETLCPDCQHYFKEQLVPAVMALGDIVNLTLVPYGNAMEKQVGDQWQFTCQHGPEECLGNLIHTCALHIVKDKPVFPFLSCMEASYERPKYSGPECASQHGIDFDPILKCTESALGNQWEHQMAEKTNMLNPPHTSVPWITLKGVHNDEIQKKALSNLTQLLCDTYKGPSVCHKKPAKSPCQRDEMFLAPPKPRPVSVALYYESLCPACKAFIKTELYPVYKVLGPAVINITLFPYGNAKETTQGNKYVYTCQHGPAECVGNVIETCALYLLKNFDQAFHYIGCIESSSKMPNESAPECAKMQKLNYKPIQMCADGAMGNKLEHRMAVSTGRLRPPHRYVPWIVVDGVHTEATQQQAQHDLLKVVCQAYKGPKPQACAKQSSIDIDRCNKN